MTDVLASDIAATPQPRRRIRWNVVTDHLVLILGSLFMTLPLIMLVLAATLEDAELAKDGLKFAIDDQLLENFDKAMFQASGFTGEQTGTRMMQNSFILGVGFAVGKIIFGMMAAYAIVYFRLRFATFAFWVIFTTLLLPLEVRILPSYEIVQSMGLINTYTGLIVPLVASATATFFFRQYFMSVPEEMVEAARIDGAGPVKFFIDILVPLSRTMIAAMFIIMFVFGWNQYLFGRQ